MLPMEEAVGALIDAQSVAFLGSVDLDGFPEVKAMYNPRERIGIRTLYLTTNDASRRVAHLRANPKACLYFFDEEPIVGVQLQGHVEVLTDIDTRRRLWRPGDALYFPHGPEDPDYSALRLTVFQGRMYSNKGSQDFIVT